MHVDQKTTKFMTEIMVTKFIVHQIYWLIGISHCRTTVFPLVASCDWPRGRHYEDFAKKSDLSTAERQQILIKGV